MILSALCLSALALGFAQEIPTPSSQFELQDVFELELAADPQFSPNGDQIVYVRRSMDIMRDRQISNLWTIKPDGSEHRPLLSGKASYSSPLWSPDGGRLLYRSPVEGSTQLYVRWMDTGQTAKLTNVTETPGSAAWSPDGRWIAFTMFVEEEPTPFASMPKQPKGANWAPAARVITGLRYRSDGAGFLREGNKHLFVIPAEGGSPRQLTQGEFNVSGTPSWDASGDALLFEAEVRSTTDFNPLDTEIFAVSVENETLTPLTDRRGPDMAPVVSPNGKHVAYLGHDDKQLGFQVTELYVMARDGSNPRSLTPTLDRGVGSPRWSPDGRGLYFSYSEEGDTKIAFVSLEGGDISERATRVGGTTLGRPYSSGSFDISTNEDIAFTQVTTQRPSDLAVIAKDGSAAKRITALNEDLFGHKDLGAVEEIRFESSHDALPLQGWIVKPPRFDASKKYPLLLEIHGGPFADYGSRFTAECQLYAAAGYVVLYMNPRGSTSYGGDFANEIHHAYPSFDYDDLMSGVDTVIGKGYIDEEQLFVTGGSGGGVLTAWIVGKTDRFRAAVVAKPVINWISHALTADAYTYFTKYWFPGFPWDHFEHYWNRSPLSLVGNVTTPTMLLTGEADYRTPMSESEQYYQALKLQKVEAALVRIPEASHGIAARPSNLIAKVAHILAWFEKYGAPATD